MHRRHQSACACLRNGPRGSNARARLGLSRSDVLITVVVLLILAVLMLPAVEQARESARREQCRNHLRNIGWALQIYHDSFWRYPSAISAWGRFPEMQASGAHHQLLGFLNHGRLDRPYRPWTQEPAEWVSVAPLQWICPSHGVETADDPYLASMSKDHKTYGMTSYVFCKGAGDAWCDDPKSVPADERGPFDVDYGIRQTHVTDGLSQTIFIGEGATGKPWRVCAGAGCDEPIRNPLSEDWWLPHQPWMVPYINTDRDLEGAGPRASLFGSTLEPMNKNPVTDTMIDSGALSDCRSSTDGGPHSTSNFRSNHPGGANFLFGDRSVVFSTRESRSNSIEIYRRSPVALLMASRPSGDEPMSCIVLGDRAERRMAASPGTRDD